MKHFELRGQECFPASGTLSLEIMQHLRDAVQEHDIRALHFRNNHLKEWFGESLGRLLNALTSIQELKFKNCVFDLSTFHQLCESIKKCSSIRTLCIESERVDYRKRIGIIGAKSMISLLNGNNTIRTLYLGWNSIEDEGTKVICESLYSNTSIRFLDLSGNGIGSDGASYLCSLLVLNSSIHTLHLSSNYLGDAGAIALSEALKVNHSIRTLNLRQNSIGDQGILSLSEALKQNTTVRMLDLSTNEFSSNAVQYISDALRENKTLYELILDNNRIRDIGAQALGEAIKENKSLHTLSLQQNNFFGVGLKTIISSLKNNYNFKVCSIFPSSFMIQQKIDAILHKFEPIQTLYTTSFSDCVVVTYEEQGIPPLQIIDTIQTNESKYIGKKRKRIDDIHCSFE